MALTKTNPDVNDLSAQIDALKADISRITTNISSSCCFAKINRIGTLVYPFQHRQVMSSAIQFSTMGSMCERIRGFHVTNKLA